MDPEARFRRLQELALAFPGDAPSLVFTLEWEGLHGVAGVASGAGGTYVYLHSGQQAVDSLEDAAYLLRRIFADEIVCVTAFAKETMVYCGLAEAHAPSVGFNRLDGPSSRDMPDIDMVMTESWLRGVHEDEDVERAER